MRLGSKRYADLRDLARDLEGRLRMSPSVAEPRMLAGLTFSGYLADDLRQACVTFEGQPGGVRIAFGVESSSAPVLRVSLERFWHRLLKRLGLLQEIQVGDVPFDDTFFLETTDAERTREVLSRAREARRAIDGCFALYRIAEIEMRAGWLWATAPIETVEPDDYTRILALLGRVARAFEPVTFAAPSLGAKKRKAIRDIKGKPRCAYCRTALTGGEPDLVACELCSTVLHEPCWLELGKCPVFGCKGKDPETARLNPINPVVVRAKPRASGPRPPGTP